jgi:hypothetical protein
MEQLLSLLGTLFVMIGAGLSVTSLMLIIVDFISGGARRLPLVGPLVIGLSGLTAGSILLWVAPHV